MTNTELLATIKRDIEEWMKETEGSQFSKGERFGYNRVLGLIHTLELDAPEGLDEAAELYEEEHISDYGYRGEWSGAFIAGAEWAFGQGATTEAEVFEANPLGESHPMILLEVSADVYKIGEKVIAQIRKK